MKRYIIVLFIFSGQIVLSQFFNKEIEAKILVEKSSEFYTFQATAENLTPSDYNLKYDYALYVTNPDGTVEKANREERFYLKANEKKILGALTVNYNREERAIIVLLIFDADDKPIGKDRIVLENGGQSDIEESSLLVAQSSQDQAAPQDGFILSGFVLEKTITQAGRQFYRYFYADYYNRGIVTKYNLKIVETPSRGRNTRVDIFVEDQLVWRFFAQPRKKFLKEQSDIAMARAIRQLQALEQIKEQFIRY